MITAVSNIPKLKKNLEKKVKWRLTNSGDHCAHKVESSRKVPAWP